MHGDMDGYAGMVSEHRQVGGMEGWGSTGPVGAVCSVPLAEKHQ